MRLFPHMRLERELEGWHQVEGIPLGGRGRGGHTYIRFTEVSSLGLAGLFWVLGRVRGLWSLLAVA